MKNELGRFFKPTQLLLSVFFLTLSTAQAAKPLWTFEPLTSTEVTVPANTTAVIQYRVTNQTITLVP